MTFQEIRLLLVLFVIVEDVDGSELFDHGVFELEVVIIVFLEVQYDFIDYDLLQIAFSFLSLRETRLAAPFPSQIHLLDQHIQLRIRVVLRHLPPRVIMGLL